MRLAKQVALVTGGNRGIGRAIAQRFVQEGAIVAIAGRDRVSLERTANELHALGKREALWIQADVGIEADCEDAVETVIAHCGTLDILVNNAAQASPARHEFAQLPTADWATVLNVNLNGMFYCGRAAARHMVARQYGRIINVLAIQAWVPLPGNAPYAASKGGGMSLTRSMAIDLAPQGVIVNAIAPGPVYVRADTVPPDVDASAATLVRRAGRPAEVAALAVFLASSECSFVVGQTVVCDGGRLLSRRGDPEWV